MVKHVNVYIEKRISNFTVCTKGIEPKQVVSIYLNPKSSNFLKKKSHSHKNLISINLMFVLFRKLQLFITQKLIQLVGIQPLSHVSNQVHLQWSTTSVLTSIQQFILWNSLSLGKANRRSPELSSSFHLSQQILKTEFQGFPELFGIKNQFYQNNFAFFRTSFLKNTSRKNDRESKQNTETERTPRNIIKAAKLKLN